LDDLRIFPAGARRMAGFQLDQVQHGEDPDDGKPMNSIGTSVREIRVRITEGACRVIHVAKSSGAIYVLHCFQKKSQQTGSKDVTLAAGCCRELVEDLK
jgi:phage-related protein